MYIGLITVHVADTDRAERWNTDVLGLETHWDARLDDGVRWLMVAPSGGQTSPAVHGR